MKRNGEHEGKGKNRSKDKGRRHKRDHKTIHRTLRTPIDAGTCSLAHPRIHCWENFLSP